ncbi:hypothetical protein CROQUDRAFT_649723 [Cronartium quercuum f. sp. fusiforme G11]|uniref:F-box domain-containing protein n=1 Tax=Cronartium quercuum f. sp. fusiforme G11 TaxID=708437 RepID=A0A9P6NU74_9BASI|nr:hypothetical protein CROQUDRAFT_649723 [Cronartium quercuum f. sp. fusiforme G11]
MNRPFPTLITIAARLPSEIIALIIHFALEDDPEMSRKQSLDCKRAKKQLIRKLRLVCKAWADYFFIHGLHDIVLTWSTRNFNIVVNRWKKRVGFGYKDIESSTPLPRVREFILHDVWDSESFRGARVTFWERESTHLDVAILTRILDLFSGHLERLHISFVDCLSFPKSSIEAVKKCTRLEYLSLSVTYDSDRLEEKRPNYRLWQAESLFDFLAAAPSLKNLTFSHWDVMTRYDLPNHQVPLCRIEELSLEGHAEPIGLSHLASVCCNINGPVKVLSIDVYNECFGGVARVTGAHARTLEALSIKTDYLFGNLDDILQDRMDFSCTRSS